MRDCLGISAYKEAYAKTDYPARMARHLFESLHLRQGMPFADVRCGDGFFLQGFTACGLQTIGVDSSTLSAQVHPELDIRHADLENGQLPLDDASCDVVFSKSFIEHLYYPEKYFQDAMRVLYELSGFSDVATQHYYQLPCVWRNPWLRHLFKAAAPFISQDNKHPFWRWVRTLQVLGTGTKPV